MGSARQLRIWGIGHINHIVEDLDEAVERYRHLFGAVLLKDIGENPVTRGCLLDVGGEIIELLAPRTLERAEGKQLARYGPHWQGIELLVPSRAEALATIQERGIETLLVQPSQFYTKPAATQGVCLQIFDGNWHADAVQHSFDNPKPSLDWWRDEHPVGYDGLAQVSFACTDLAVAEAFWCDLTGATVLDRAARPDAAAEGVLLDMGIPVELLAPTGEGALSRYLERYGPRIRAVTYRVAALDRTTKHFAGLGIDLEQGDLPDSLALPADEIFSVTFQFVE